MNGESRVDREAAAQAESTPDQPKSVLDRVLSIFTRAMWPALASSMKVE